MADDPVRLIHGDALAVLPTLPDASVDCVITDPPYNVGIDYGSTDDHRGDYESWCAAWFAELKRVCRGPIAISCGMANVAMWCRIEPPHWWLCWWKPAAMGRSPTGFNNWEPIALYGKAGGKKTSDVIRACIRPDAALNGHPCPKPLEWASQQIEMLSRPDAVVLDPFLGIGTVPVACMQKGRRFVGCEIDLGYFAAARQAVANAQTGGPLFAPPMFDFAARKEDEP